MNKLRKTVNVAHEQIDLKGAGFAFIIVRFDDFVGDFIQTYLTQLINFCSVEKSVVIKNGHRGNIITHSPELFT
jgi:hypothetical protein